MRGKDADWSGSCKYGLGLINKSTIPKNFDYPYASPAIDDFWRRWHISLSSWLRDYLYIPLGGSKAGELKTYRNLVIVFVLCGLWHGAAWTFLLWGLWHGAFLVGERLAQKAGFQVLSASHGVGTPHAGHLDGLSLPPL